MHNNLLYVPLTCDPTKSWIIAFIVMSGTCYYLCELTIVFFDSFPSYLFLFIFLFSFYRKISVKGGAQIKRDKVCKDFFFFFFFFLYMCLLSFSFFFPFFLSFFFVTTGVATRYLCKFCNILLVKTDLSSWQLEQAFPISRKKKELIPTCSPLERRLVKIMIVLRFFSMTILSLSYLLSYNSRLFIFDKYK